MAHPSTLNAIVEAGCDLNLTTAVHPNVLKELAATAQRTGARLTVTTSIHPSVIKNLLDTHGKAVAFIDGLESFEKKG